jgi:tetratricopeptide (TPR) repeat protein
MTHHHYDDQEKHDAGQVDFAERLIKNGQIAEGRSVLEDVASRAPAFYAYNFGNDKQQFIKFWSLAEYLGYIKMTRKPGEPVEQEIVWLPSAYPRALFRMAEIEIDNGNDALAAEFLDHALQLEPDHPECLLAMAGIYARDDNHEQAIDMYDLTLGSRPYMTPATMAHALAGKAQQLIELDRIDEADKLLEESLRCKPDNHLAENLQRYVESVRAGNVTAPVEVDQVDTHEPQAAPAPPPPEPQPQREPEPEPQSQPSKRRWWQKWRK